MDVLVIIPSYGHFDFVKACVESLVRNPGTPNRKVQYCLIDDASPEWYSIDWNTWAAQPISRYHFSSRGGLSRSWNEGLKIARSMGVRHAVCANSDILFSPGWLEPLINALDAGHAIVGPLTNAPGHATWQNVRPFCSYHTSSPIDDSEQSRFEISQALSDAKIGPIEAPLNGFLLVSSVETWWKGSFDSTNVFNPEFPLARNEVDLQNRWRGLGLTSAVVPQSYVFHYRSVSRPEGLQGRSATGAFRPLRNLAENT